MSNAFAFDVFLSHNRNDKPRVLRLAERLQAAGLRVWYDDWAVKPGDQIFLAVENGLQAARVLVLCLSPHALGSGWVGLERATVMFRDPGNAGRRSSRCCSPTATSRTRCVATNMWTIARRPTRPLGNC